MRLLVLGGTVFLGRHVVEAALARGHDARVGGMLLADNRRAVAAGLTFRPLADTIHATLVWDRAEGAQPTERPIRATPMAPEREAELLARRT